MTTPEQSTHDTDTPLTRFRAAVRQEVLRQHFGPSDWCAAGTNEVLAALDLDPLNVTYEGVVTVSVHVTVTHTDVERRPDLARHIREDRPADLDL